MFGLEPSPTDEDKREALEWAKHLHWVDTHRNCAVCGELVLSRDLECAVNRGIRIHPDYTHWYAKVPEDEIGYLLIVHQRCNPETQRIWRAEAT